MEKTDFSIALASLPRNQTKNKKQRSNDVIMQKAREHLTLYYLNGKDGLYNDFPDYFLQIVLHIPALYEKL